MIRQATLAVFVVAIAPVPYLHAQNPDVDWKFYGAATVESASACFYDASGVIKGPDGNISVSTKCLAQEDLNRINIKTGKILKNAANKAAHNYIPPFATVQTIDSNQRLAITRYEEIANIGPIQPKLKIFYELNCAQQMLRELTIDIEIKGKRSTKNTPNEWKHVSPETNGYTLLKLMCQ